MLVVAYGALGELPHFETSAGVLYPSSAVSLSVTNFDVRDIHDVSAVWEYHIRLEVVIDTRVFELRCRVIDRYQEEYHGRHETSALVISVSGQLSHGIRYEAIHAVNTLVNVLVSQSQQFSSALPLAEAPSRRRKCSCSADQLPQAPSHKGRSMRI